MSRRENTRNQCRIHGRYCLFAIDFLPCDYNDECDSGINKKLSEKPPPDYKPPIIKEKNILEVNINRNNELMVEGDRMELKDLKEAAIKFIDNGGGVGKPGEDGTLVNHVTQKENELNLLQIIPIKRLSPVQSDRGTEYGTYIAVQDELLKAYTVLRNRLSQERLRNALY